MQPKPIYIYFILEGNNDATYILNLKDRNTIALSLNFYKARSLKQRVMKSALKVYLGGLRQLARIITLGTLKNQEEITRYLQDESSKTIDFGVNESCSILVSPTRDKVIAHHHGEYFHKFAFGKSYHNVKNEAHIYSLLRGSMRHFKVSTFYDLEDNVQKGFCSFKLGYTSRSPSYDVDLTEALVEMFNVSKQTTCSWTTYVEHLEARYKKSGFSHPAINSAIAKLNASSTDTMIPLGLVHRDFKPWNINDEHGLLIYDFEEAVTDGPPLEDLFNFYVDPMINYVSTDDVVEYILTTDKVKEYQRYLQKLNIAIDFHLFLFVYLLERVIFYTNIEEATVRATYIDLLEYVMKK